MAFAYRINLCTGISVHPFEPSTTGCYKCIVIISPFWRGTWSCSVTVSGLLADHLTCRWDRTNMNSVFWLQSPCFLLSPPGLRQTDMMPMFYLNALPTPPYTDVSKVFGSTHYGGSLPRMPCDPGTGYSALSVLSSVIGDGNSYFLDLLWASHELICLSPLAPCLVHTKCYIKWELFWAENPHSVSEQKP